MLRKYSMVETAWREDQDNAATGVRSIKRIHYHDNRKMPLLIKARASPAHSQDELHHSVGVRVKLCRFRAN